MRKIILLIIVLATMINFLPNVAYSDASDNYDEIIRKYAQMSINDLQKEIKRLGEFNKYSRASHTGGVMWLAAAAIARKSGYPLSATLVEHSVFAKNYNERNGQFAVVITRSDEFKRMNLESGSIGFVSDRDLFYSLHKVAYFTNNSYDGGRQMIVTDTFDFEGKWDSTWNLFANLVNYFGYLSQQWDSLYKIEIQIEIDISNGYTRNVKK